MILRNTLTASNTDSIVLLISICWWFLALYRLRCIKLWRWIVWKSSQFLYWWSGNLCHISSFRNRCNLIDLRWHLSITWLLIILSFRSLCVFSTFLYLFPYVFLLKLIIIIVIIIIFPQTLCFTFLSFTKFFQLLSSILSVQWSRFSLLRVFSSYIRMCLWTFRDDTLSVLLHRGPWGFIDALIIILLLRWLFL